VQVTGHNSSWVSPFGHPRINARLPTPQGISQAPTSFIGSRCQGIHHAPLPTCHTNHQHTQQTPPQGRHPSTAPALCVFNMIKTQNDIQHYKRHTHTCPNQQNGQGSICMMLASTIQISNNQKPNQPPHTHKVCERSDASDTQQRAIQLTRLHPPTPQRGASRLSRHCVPLVNNPNRNSTNGCCQGCCSLERR
jgi:hypothetical protein